MGSLVFRPEVKLIETDWKEVIETDWKEVIETTFCTRIEIIWQPRRIYLKFRHNIWRCDEDDDEDDYYYD